MKQIKKQLKKLNNKKTRLLKNFTSGKYNTFKKFNNKLKELNVINDNIKMLQDLNNTLNLVCFNL